MIERKSNAISTTENISLSTTQGYSIRIGAFYAWAEKHGYSPYRIAKALNMQEEDMKKRLNEKQFFTKSQLKRLIRLMGANSAFFVIHFPSFKFRRQVYFEVFGKELQTNKRKRRYKKE